LKYTSKQVCEIFKISRSRLHQLRAGYHHKFKQGGKQYEYKVYPVINEGKDWMFERGKIAYLESAVKKLKKYFKRREK
jgi:hypothetical protein